MDMPMIWFLGHVVCACFFGGLDGPLQFWKLRQRCADGCRDVCEAVAWVNSTAVMIDSAGDSSRTTFGRLNLLYFANRGNDL